ncbi:MAG: ATP synthase subunit I [Pseudomonadota bacterium]|nr:ATP synthase subunit I [Pseudomonadota bacterium]MDO7667814.1 ATP synthase subunit I [Pseudomonadota bacterium]MDO7710395.1 ATP synthase subunit I [Pseudomonadota bacterium]
MAGLILSIIVGMALGLFFFGGLWWTVRKAINSSNPALWFFGSVMLRMAFVISGFYLVMAGDWRRLCIALVGFIIARILVTRFSPSPQENSHAP